MKNSICYTKLNGTDDDHEINDQNETKYMNLCVEKQENTYTHNIQCSKKPYEMCTM